MRILGDLAKVRPSTTMNRDRSSNDAAATSERSHGLHSEDQGGSPVLQFIVVGLVLGSIYALAASGLVITYVSTGVLNFAFGSLAYFIARTYYYLHVEKELGHPARRPRCACFVLAPALGLFLYLAIFRFLRLSSQLIKVVVTIGFSVVDPGARRHDLRQRGDLLQAPGLAPAAGRASTTCSAPR